MHGVRDGFSGAPDQRGNHEHRGEIDNERKVQRPRRVLRQQPGDQRAERVNVVIVFVARPVDRAEKSGKVSCD